MWSLLPSYLSDGGDHPQSLAESRQGASHHGTSAGVEMNLTHLLACTFFTLFTNPAVLLEETAHSTVSHTTWWRMLGGSRHQHGLVGNAGGGRCTTGFDKGRIKSNFKVFLQLPTRENRFLCGDGYVSCYQQ